MTIDDLNKRFAELTMHPDDYHIEDGKVVVFDLDVFTKYFKPCSNWNDLMSTVVKLGVTYRKFTVWGDVEYSAFTISEFYETITSSYSMTISNEKRDSDLMVALVKCCIAVLEANQNKGE